LAMGGSRSGLVRQLLAESLLITLLGTAVGLAVAPLVSRSLAALLMSGNRMSGDGFLLDTSLDLRVFGFAALLVIVVTLLIGLAPALRATGSSLSKQIKNGQYSRQSHPRRVLLPRVLLASEVALALILVIGAGLLATSLARLFGSGVGFDPRGLVNISFKMDKQPLEGDALMRVYQQIGEGLSRQPGVKNVSFQFIVPLSHLGWNGNYSVPGANPRLLYLNSVAPNYFATMRIPMFAGREFRWDDTRASGAKIILNESAAKLLFPGRSAVGQQITSVDDKKLCEVVAVVGDAKYRDMNRVPPPAAYVPIMQDESSKPSLSAVVRVDGPLASLASAARLLTTRLAPAIPAPVLTTVDEVMNNATSSERMMALLSTFFAVCALLVTAIGLYGTLAYTTAQRTSEIGIRMALGAQREGVMARIFWDNAVVAVAGCGAGLVIALLTSRVLANLLYGTSAHDPWVILGSVGMLIAIASMASLLPALRASRIEPVVAIRYES
jgi:predicted permease